MKIAVISDIHGSIEALDSIQKNIVPNIDELWFLGDLYFDYKNNEDTPKNRKIIYEWVKEISKDKLKVIINGNCDYKETTDNEFFYNKSTLVKDFLGNKILLEHGHELKDENRKEHLIESECNILLSGHTHIGYISIEEGLLFLNPGSVAYPRDEANIPTYILLNDETKTISILSVDKNELIQELIIY